MLSSLVVREANRLSSAERESVLDQGAAAVR
jgi:hypothetical protein